MLSNNINTEKYNSIPSVDNETVEMLKQHAGGDIEVLRDLFASFFPEASEQIDELMMAAETENLELFKRSAHGLSGISATIGAFQLKALSADMENYVKTGNTDKAYELLKLVKPFYEKFVEQANEVLS